MSDSLVGRIRDFALAQKQSFPFPPATEAAVKSAEEELGFPIPPLLRACYLEIGNGGYGPGYGIIGLEGGYESDLGTLVACYREIKDGQSRKRWPSTLLPFCEWGCNIFSCVNCDQPPFEIFTSEECRASSEECDLERFFELWFNDICILDQNAEFEEVSAINPFTRQPTTIKKRKPRHSK